MRGLQVFCRDDIQRQNGIHSSFIYLCFISYSPWKGEEEESIKIQTATRKEFVFPNIILDYVINKQLEVEVAKLKFFLWIFFKILLSQACARKNDRIWHKEKLPIIVILPYRARYKTIYSPTTSSRTSFQCSSLPFSWIMVTVILRWIPWQSSETKHCWSIHTHASILHLHCKCEVNNIVLTSL